MKTALLHIAFIFFTLPVMAQTGWSREDRTNWKEGDFAFYQGDYAYAYELLSEVRKADTTYAPVNFELGVIEMDWFQNKQRAEQLLQQAVDAGIKEAYFHFGRLMHRQMRFEEALRWCDRYASSGDQSLSAEEVQRQIDITRRAMVAVTKPVDVAISNLGPVVNTEAKEYVPLVTPDNNTLYFTSRRDDSTAQLKDPNGEYFEDIYKSVRDSVGWKLPVNVGQPINSETHDATVSISADGKTMLLYRTNRNLTGGDIYISHYRNGSWSAPEKLSESINSEYQEASATISPEKDMIIFSSNRPGGYGGKDLYRVRKLPNGDWSLPRNLGPSINTSFDEDAPHLDIDANTLYFASQGHNTIGGFDLFVTEQTERDVWSTPINLGYPANTVDDDIFLSVDAGGRNGYFSSAREGGFGQQDLYGIDFIYRKEKLIVIKSETLDLSTQPVAAKITVIDKTTRDVQGVYRSNSETGRFILILNPLTEYQLIIESAGYPTTSEELYFPFPKTEEESELNITPYILQEK